MKKIQKICVVGAGISGLYMAYLLILKGHEVCIWEANDYAGGRIKQIDLANIKIDAGAQWLHEIGEKHNLLTKWIQDHHEQFERDQTDFDVTYLYKGKSQKYEPKEFNDFIDYLCKKTMAEDQSVAATLKDFGSDKYLDGYVNSFLVDMAASIDTFSSRSLQSLIRTASPNNYVLKGKTMWSFIVDSFTETIKTAIRFGQPVTKINYQKEKVLVYSRDVVESFDRVILSVPITQLQNRSIVFLPALKVEKQEAIDSIAMGQGFKVFLLFNKKIIDGEYFNLKYAPYYIAKDLDGDKQLLITLLMGNFASTYKQDPIDYEKNMLMELSDLTHCNIQTFLEDKLFFNWSNAPYIEGTYSYPKVGEKDSRSIASTAIDDKIYFIGEAMNLDSEYGFIHGAMQTAQNLADKF